jgi:hypothetical protein
MRAKPCSGEYQMKKHTFLIELDAPDGITPEQIKQIVRDGVQFRTNHFKEGDPLKRVKINLMNLWSTKHA